MSAGRKRLLFYLFLYPEAIVYKIKNHSFIHKKVVANRMHHANILIKRFDALGFGKVYPVVLGSEALAIAPDRFLQNCAVEVDSSALVVGADGIGGLLLLVKAFIEGENGHAIACIKEEILLFASGFQLDDDFIAGAEAQL